VGVRRGTASGAECRAELGGGLAVRLTSTGPRRFARLVRRLSQQSGIQTIRMHDLRHTHATLLLEDGLDAKYVSERLGHDSVQTTLELYGHVTSRRRRDAAKRIGAMVDGLAAAEIRDPAVTPDGPGAERGGL
jgi:integrase